MTWLLVLAIVSLALAALPVALFVSNVAQFRRAPVPTVADAAHRPRVSILIPARDEEQSIRACVDAALASHGVEIEVIVLDDHSRDRTAPIVRELAATDPRLRLETAPPLPAGWCGKQHACHALSELAAHDLLLFIDADVRLAPDAAARAVAFLEQSGAALVSGFPQQETESLLEKLLLPLIHVVLLGYLPMWAMRRRPTDPAFGAGCGQFILARRSAYERVGGHAAVRRSLHDGLKLPRAFRAAGFATDLFDASNVAACRMYRSGRACWNGLVKNATEGMASPAAIVPWTVLLLGGHVLPPCLLLAAWGAGATEAAVVAGVATMLPYAMRIEGAIRFGHSFVGVLLHPVAVALLVMIQWEALLRMLAGRPAGWKGRSYAPAVAD
jgi:hypothetical protein